MLEIIVKRLKKEKEKKQKQAIKNLKLEKQKLIA